MSVTSKSFEFFCSVRYVCGSRKFRGATGQYFRRSASIDGYASARSSPMYQGARLFCSGSPRFTKKSQTELAYIDILANLKIRLDSVKRMTQIQNTS